MKKLISTLAVGFALGAVAAPEKVLDVQLASGDALIEAATKLGEFAGEPSLGMMAAGAISQVPDSEEDFKKMLTGKTRLALYVDAEGKADMDEVFGAASPKFENAPLLGKGVVACVNINEKGIALALRALDELAKEADDEAEKTQCAQFAGFVKQLKGMALSAAVTDAGLDVFATFEPVEGTMLDKVGAKSIKAGSPLAFAGKGSLYAVAYAQDCCAGNFGAQWPKFADVLAKHGIKTDFLKTTREGDNFKVKLDFPALVKYAQGEGQAAFGKLGEDREALEKFFADIQAVMPAVPVLEGPEQGVALYIDGVATDDAAKRFDKVIPGAMAKKPCSIGVFSLYGVIKAIAVKVGELPDNEQAEMIKAFVKGMPAETGADIATLCWKDAKGLKLQVRATPAEIKGLAAIGKTLSMACGPMMMDCGVECDDEDDETGDED